ncbi:MAG: hypothetical protein Q7S18_03015, partial [bacterium]|nr:hypothetical protein [bacterium]
MRNTVSTSKIISKSVSSLPYFTLEKLTPIIKNKPYLKIILSRKAKNGEIIRLKKGYYVSKNYLDSAEKRGILSHFVEFTANLIYSPSYLSLEYVLYENNILTEIPKNITSVST